MRFEIEYRETCVGYFTVEAPDEVAAIDEFWKQVGNGKIELLNTYITDSDAAVVGVEEEEESQCPGQCGM